MEARVRLAVALGGAVGSIGRVVVGAVLLGTSPLPAATLLVNVSGTAALAVIGTRLTDPVLRAALLTGVLGSWTTVSGLAVEVVALGGGRGAPEALAYLVVTLLSGAAAAVAGHRWTRRAAGGPR